MPRGKCPDVVLPRGFTVVSCRAITKLDYDPPIGRSVTSNAQLISFFSHGTDKLYVIFVFVCVRLGTRSSSKIEVVLRKATKFGLRKIHSFLFAYVVRWCSRC